MILLMSEEEKKVENTAKSEVARREEEILEFWREHQIFEQTESRPGKNGDFVFYDGPPFATGMPHFGHLLPTSIKDAIPRYQTMQGKRVFRRWGWDCHGLPVENVVEKDLGLKIKKDIENLGIDVFNETARETVLRYADEWKKIIPRMGRWVDMDNDYKTMNPSYSESIWWIFKTLHDKGLIYQGFKSMQLCPRCETTLSNFEVNQGYKDITDISVYVKFELVDEPGTYLVAWTTTPWTLPGNVALAVNPEVEYSIVRQGDSLYIVGSELAAKVFKEEFVVIKTVLGQELVGKSYKPVFDYYYQDEKLSNRENGWKVYAGDFVTTDSGTGVVHVAPAFGEDDLKLAQINNLPFIQHVATSGEFRPEVVDFAGLQAKPKDDHQATDIEVIKSLALKGVLFAKEKIIHSYPHCWRCATPLLNYASSSWFVKVTDFKDKLVANNQQITWVPDHIKDGRFGKWLEGARDWAISRSRFWGAPLPVWKCSTCKKVEVVSSIDDLLSKLPSRGNRFIFMRHGESEANIKDVISDDPLEENHLTEEGKRQVMQTAESLKDKHITHIIASPFVRTKETAQLVAETIGFDPGSVIIEDRLHELKSGGWNGKSLSEYNALFASRLERFTKPLPGGESIHEISSRMLETLFEINSNHENSTFLIVSHGLPLFVVEQYLQHQTFDDLMRIESWNDLYFKTGEAKELNLKPYPHNKNFEIDLHRPYIDEVKWSCSCGGEFIRVPDVFDCWFESGSMPYGQVHYPFATNPNFDPQTNKNFPADFIAEGLDQTRGWFYSLLVLATALFNKPAFTNVIVNGLILAEDGQKMSKSLRNYPDIYPTIEKYGADALRFYLLNSPAVHADEFSFSERALGETARRVLARLQNVVSFYELYSSGEVIGKAPSTNILDRWIMSRLGQTVREVTKAMDGFELDRAVRPIDDFIDDLSNWYLRRSRDRFKSDNVADREMAITTTRSVLFTLAKVMAPFTPFIAENLFQKLRTKEDELSVHLCYWPDGFVVDEDTIETMVRVREVVEQGLRLRAESGIKVRQPLSKIILKESIPQDFWQVIKEELNLKAIEINNQSAEAIILDTVITSELKEEGVARDLIRHIQDLRKQNNLEPSDVMTLIIDTDSTGKELVNKFINEIMTTTNTREIIFEDIEKLDGGVLQVDDLLFRVELR